MSTAVAALAADCDTNLTGNTSARPPLKLNVWSYHGQKDFSRAHHMSLYLDAKAKNYSVKMMGYIDGEGYKLVGRNSVERYDQPQQSYVNPAYAELQNGSFGKTTFERLQRYSLEIMSKRKYLSAEQLDEQIQISLQLKPNQVTIIEASESLPESQLPADYRSRPDFRLDSEANAVDSYRRRRDGIHPHFYKEPEYVKKPYEKIYEQKVALSWLIAGQDVAAQYKLPLQNEQLINKIDRNKYRHIWEIGRAGQTKLGAFEETLRAAAYTAYTQLIINGGMLEDAYIFTHALDPVRARAFKSAFGMTEFSGYTNDKDEKCLVAPLSKLLELFPLDTFSPIVAQVRAASKNKLSDRDALKLIVRMRSLRHFNIDTRGYHTYPIRDFSNLALSIIELEYIANAYPVEVMKDVLKVLARIEPIVAESDSIEQFAVKRQGDLGRVRVDGTPLDPSKTDQFQPELMPLRTFLKNNNALEIQAPTIENQYARGSIYPTDPNEALKELYEVITDRLWFLPLHEEPLQFLVKHKIKLCFSDFDNWGRGVSSYQMWIERYSKPATEWFVHRKFWNPLKFGGFSIGGLEIREVTAKSYCYEPQAVKSWFQNMEHFEKAGIQYRQIRQMKEVEKPEELLKNPQLYEP